MVRGRAGGLAVESRVFSIYNCFFLSVGMVELVWFGLVKSVSDFENRNRTELEFFL